LWAACLSLGLALAPAAAVAQEMAMPLESQWALLDRILAYDRTFDDRASDGLVVGVLYQSRYRPSLAAHDEILGLSRRLSLQLAGRNVRIVSIEVTTPFEVAAQIAEAGVDALYFTPLRAARIEELAAVSIEHRLATLTGVREYVGLGVAIGLDLRGGYPEILVNLAQSRSQGMDLSSELLKLNAIVLIESDR
jgi:hypothetical protein